jgi:hypothetical protein
MSTGSPNYSAEPPSEAEPPFTSERRQFWRASLGRHPVTWTLAGVVLLTSGGVALIQHQPGARARAQSVYCGLVTCAVLRSVAESSSAVGAVPRPSLALPSSEAPSRATAPTRTSRPTRTTQAPARSGAPQQVAASNSAPAPSPKPAAPSPAPWPTRPPRPARWPWPPTWGWPGGGGRPGGGGWGGGGGWPGGRGGGGGRHTQQADYQPRHAY